MSHPLTARRIHRALDVLTFLLAAALIGFGFGLLLLTGAGR